MRPKQGVVVLPGEVEPAGAAMLARAPQAVERVVESRLGEVAVVGNEQGDADAGVAIPCTALRIGRRRDGGGGEQPLICVEQRRDREGRRQNPFAMFR